ncbi:hypothetical protein DN752_06435 [Echinicola strongylocentroti]|uniref:Uncharacterized protein n=1 Tax=Echinicola strongylocentroti TaxID=1795355 RepID=A0A2Z4IFQ8_9BACT|nr:hypothetical protein DN752_06435 [Echinicola strongylocentroti]
MKGNTFRVGIAIIRAAGTPSGGLGELKFLRMNPQVTKFVVPLALCPDLYIGNRSSLGSSQRLNPDYVLGIVVRAEIARKSVSLEALA